jgi:hypothetical protein
VSGAAGIGIARARSMRDGGGYAAALAEGQSPYPAFAAPGGTQHNGQAPVAGVPYRGPGSPEFDLLEAAGVGSGAVAGVVRGSSMTMNSRPAQPVDNSHLSRSKSVGVRSVGDPTSDYTSPQSESYASHYQPGFRGDVGGHQTYGSQDSHPGAAGSDATYGAYAPSQSHTQRSPSAASASLGSPGTLPNPFSASTTHSGVHGDESGSYLDSDGEGDEEDSGVQRVLKVLFVVFILSSVADLKSRLRMNNGIDGYTILWTGFMALVCSDSRHLQLRHTSFLPSHWTLHSTYSTTYLPLDSSVIYYFLTFLAYPLCFCISMFT